MNRRRQKSAIGPRISSRAFSRERLPLSSMDGPRMTEKIVSEKSQLLARPLCGASGIL